jgi:hypothetical protein
VEEVARWWMKIVNGYPPIYDRARDVFPLSGREIFAWGDTIYNPGHCDIPPWLIDHERMHQKQQGDDVEGWWGRYLDDPEFRFKMELEAHQREYRSYCAHVKDRNAHGRYLIVVARKLAAPLYGGLLSISEAKRRITNG